jgi:serine/threonine-protein kinase RIO1
MEAINQFHQEDWIEVIFKMVRGGKEASVYLCSRLPGKSSHWIAAEVYRPRRFCNLKNDHLYREGRDQLDTSGQVIHDDRSLHAMRKRTSYGRELPRPFASSDNAILIDFIGDESYPVLTLNTVTLRAAEARQLFKRVMYHIKLMLRFNRIHADPSAYNFLYWRGGIKLIDFPQAIHPDENRNAYCIFASDVERVCEYFTSQGMEADPAGLARGYGNPGGGR